MLRAVFFDSGCLLHCPTCLCQFRFASLPAVLGQISNVVWQGLLFVFVIICTSSVLLPVIIDCLSTLPSLLEMHPRQVPFTFLILTHSLTCTLEMLVATCVSISSTYCEYSLAYLAAGIGRTYFATSTINSRSAHKK